MKKAVKDTFIKVNGGNIWYTIFNSTIKNTPLLLVHGGPGSASGYLQNIARYIDDRPIIIYDQLGCGKSDRPLNKKLWKISRFVEEINCIKSQLELDNFDLLGYSFGSMIAVDYVLKNHNAINKLILASPVLSIKQHISDMWQLLEQFSLDIKNVIVNGERSKIYNSPAYQNALKVILNERFCRLKPWPDILASALKNSNIQMRNIMWGPSEFSVSGNLRTYERIEELHKITIPTLIICGRYDLTNPSTCKIYKQHLCNATLKIFPDSSHTPQLEEANAYYTCLKQYLLS